MDEDMTKNNNTAELKIPEEIISHPAWFRLNDQLNWYDTKSVTCQKWYKISKKIQIILAALIPITSLLPEIWAKCIASTFGALIAIIEGIQQLQQYSGLWFSYRATAEKLKHEKYLFLSCAGVYHVEDISSRLRLLAERVEEHVSVEHANWFNESKKVFGSKKVS